MPADTIVAIATPPGAGGVGIVRLSGPDAVEIAQQLAPAACVAELSARVLTRITLVCADGLRDDALFVRMPAPHSYTGEDVVEVHTHGSPVIMDAAVRAAVAAGARVAAPGEFTHRAFLNGRMDLAQAEAVADLIHARTAAAARCAGRQLSGGLSAEVESLRDTLMHLLAEIEAGLDFSEEELELPTHAEYAARIGTVREQVQALLNTARTGHLLAAGAAVALVGRPNAGKSSLFNALLRRERAIVTAEPGTTRDTVEGEIDLDGVPLRLIDTAGVREAKSEAERRGVERSRAAVAEADVILWVVDRSQPWAGDNDCITDEQRARTILLYNKCDLPAALDTPTDAPVCSTAAKSPTSAAAATVNVSAKTGAGLDVLHEALRNMLQLNGVLDGESPVIVRARHADALQQTVAALDTARTALADGITLDCVAIDIRAAMDALGDIVGARTTEDLLNHIFGQFCIGK